VYLKFSKSFYKASSDKCEQTKFKFNTRQTQC